MSHEDLIKKIACLEEKVSILERQVKNNNKDGLPIGIEIFAEAEGIGKIVLGVKRNCYQVKKIADIPLERGKEFNSLSQAAEFFSKIKRKSGWIYWRDDISGRTLKDAYKG